MPDIRYFSPITGTSYRETSREDLQAAAYVLDLEYRAEGHRIDRANIDEKVASALSAKKLETFAVYIPLVQKIINEENNNYVVPPHRYFTRENGDPLPEAISRAFERLYEAFDFNNKMREFDRQSAYEGTVAVRPVISPDEGFFVKLVPSDDTFDLIPGYLSPSSPEALKYKTGSGKNTITHIWDKYFYTYTVSINSQEESFSEPHGFPGLPYGILRSKDDSRRVWGPYDGGLYSFCKLRSLLMADAVHRTQVSLYEILVMSGFSLEEATAAMKTRQAGKFVAYELPDKPDGSKDAGSKEIRFESPQGIESEKILDTYFRLYYHLVTTRGHAVRNFETGKQPQAAEAIWLGDNALRAYQISRRSPLSAFEKKIVKLMAWENNKIPGRQELPLDVTVWLDWVPDPIYFTSATDKVNYYDFMLKNGLKSHTEIIRSENPDLSRETAQQKLDENVEALKKYGPPEPVSKETDRPAENLTKTG